VSESPLEDVKSRIDIAELIGQSVQLRRAGRNLKGLCPFHSEKTPSFIVWPETGTWKCFGCGERGDAFEFLMKRDHLEFGEALRILADKAGVELPVRSTRSAELEEEHGRLFEALQAAAIFYHGLLGSPAGEAGRAYLRRRGLSTETIDSNLLGVSPPTGGALERHLLGAGFTVAEGEAAGLIGSGERGTYDWFRGRIMFPIRDAKGRVVGFGARALGDDVQPKYLNSPQTPLFDKGALLYGLDRARQAIRSEQRAVVVEGYMDVLAVHQHGFMNVVATLGTAITERHLDQLKRLTPEVVLALDADSAGRMATDRGIEVARGMAPDEVIPEVAVRESKTGALKPLIRYRSVRKTQIKVALLPAGLDPDDLVRRDPDGWKRLVDTALAVVDFALSRLGERHDLTRPEGKSAAAAEALGVIREIADPVERAHYLQRLGKLLGVEERVLAEQVGRPTAEARRAASPPESQATGDILDEYTVALATKLGAQAAHLVPATDLETAEARALLRHVEGMPGRVPGDLASLRNGVEPWLEPCLDRVSQHASTWDLVATDDLERQLEVSLLRLRLRALFRRQRELQTILADGDFEEARRWQQELAQVAQELLPVQRALLSRERGGSPA
jgi:DNA primase